MDVLERLAEHLHGDAVLVGQITLPAVLIDLLQPVLGDIVIGDVDQLRDLLILLLELLLGVVGVVLLDHLDVMGMQLLVAETCTLL